MVKCLVTGGAGFIGSHLVDELIGLGHTVMCVDNESAESNDEFYWNNNAVNIKADVCEYESVYSLMAGVDTVFHLAAEARIQPSLKNPIKTISTNVVGTANVLQAALENRVRRVVYSSTSSAYGKINKMPLEETMPSDCLTPYSVSKVAGEDLCRMYTRLFGLETITLRYFNVYGLRQPLKGQYAPVIGIFLKQHANKIPMTVIGDGEQRRDFTHVYDVVRANITAIETTNKDAYGEVFNIGTGDSHSMLDIVKYVGGEHVHVEERQGEARYTLADNKKASNILGWDSYIKLPYWIDSNRDIYGKEKEVCG
tara:strand:- start:871 stop:1803 length:933 start_codon:yes stop_codon:yes gene_type:complete